MSAEETHSAPLALPAPDPNDSDVQKLQLNSETLSSLRFDKLGPMVVNSNGVSTFAFLCHVGRLIRRLTDFVKNYELG